MGRPKKYPDELVERAVRLALESGRTIAHRFRRHDEFDELPPSASDNGKAANEDQDEDQPRAVRGLRELGGRSGACLRPRAVAQVEPLTAGRCIRSVERHPGKRWSHVAGGLLLPALLLALPGRAAAREPAIRAASLKRCDSALVHYTRYRGAGEGLAQLAWIAASPASAGLVGHLFYYDRFNVWEQKHLPGLRLYSGGQGPDGRISMKILWELRRGSALDLSVQGRRLDGSGSFSQQLSPTSSNPRQFPSIIDVPAPGCWRLTLATGKAKASVSALVVRGKQV